MSENINSNPGSKSCINDQQAFVLRSYPYRETSLIAEIFTRDHGRFGVVARGVRRLKSKYRGLLQPFQSLQLSWFGKNELKTLHHIECYDMPSGLTGTAFWCGFYVNELLLKLLHRDDPHEELFRRYNDTLQQLRSHTSYDAILRCFEKSLLQQLGYGLILDHEVATGAPIKEQEDYHYVIEHGPMPVESRDRSGSIVHCVSMSNAIILKGKTLLDMLHDNYSDFVTLQQSKLLMRGMINHYLNGQKLNTRLLLRELRQS
jgi:DNA repair protein RecO (recombination protein O)